jgi:ADP-ribose pyrophosphatase YjhB (NUDIX family)
MHEGAERDLERNPRIRIRDIEVTSNSWHVLRRTTFDYLRADGTWETQQRETYDRGNGATILLYDDDPETAIRREASEELGVEVGPLDHVYDVYMSPGSVTERVHFYAASYRPTDRTSAGGGVEAEGEDIEVLELDFDDALAMIRDGRIVDGKTIMLLQWAALRGPFRRR